MSSDINTGDIYSVSSVLNAFTPYISQMAKVILTYALPTVAQILNRIYFQGQGATSNAQLNTYASNVATSWNSHMAGQTMPQVQLTGVLVEDMTAPGAPVGAWAGSNAGSSTGTDVLTPGTALIIRNHTPIRSRGGHSRVYLPGMPGSGLTVPDSANWSATFAAAVLGAWNAFISGITGSNGPGGYTGWTQCVPNYYHGFVVVTNPITKRTRNVPNPVLNPTATNVASTSVNLIIGTQRRRNHQSV